MESENEADIEYLIQDIKISLQLILDKLEIACIDKNTENRLIDFCMQDKRCQKGQYDCKYLENLIERELIEAMW
jgi:dissimilatory sulfite reductase (desulfoviridin) alpha/beta subunit